MRPILFVVRAGAVVAGLAFLVAVLEPGPDPEASGGRAAARAAVIVAGPERPRTPARAAAETPSPGRLTIAAVGDIVMGSTPNLPPGGGAGFFSRVQADLAADVVLGNLEGTLSTRGASKCTPQSTDCFSFRTPPSYAKWLRRAGFTVLNLANNHAFDYGAAGRRQTVAALRGHGLAHTGGRGEVAYLRVGDITVAVVGFAPYPWAQSLTDLPAARRLVRRADAKADVVIATMHAGAEGADHQHVPRATERYLGENRGDVAAFAHAVVDAGADLVVGHGPHVLRGMEWYGGRLIAYSLGNFAGYKVFSLGGPLGVSGILRVTLRGDGTFETGLLVPTVLRGPGVPALDPAGQAHALVRRLSREDFGARAVAVDRAGALGR